MPSEVRRIEWTHVKNNQDNWQWPRRPKSDKTKRTTLEVTATMCKSGWSSACKSKITPEKERMAAMSLIQ